MADLDFEIDFFADDSGGIYVKVRCPFGTGQGRFSLSDLEWPEASLVARDGGASADDLRRFGESLFSALFRDKVLALFFLSVGRLAQGQQLRIQFRLALDNPDLLRIHALPWELLYSVQAGKFLALDRRFSIVRHIEVPQPERPISYRPPLRILCVASQPQGYETLKVHEELAWIEKAWARPWRKVKIYALRHASLAEMHAALLGHGVHLLHFLGHGEYDPISGEGMLLFEDEMGEPRRVTGEELAEQVADHPGLRGVFLNACWTAKAGLGSPFAGVATALVRAGVPAVLGMQFEISDPAAREFSRAVYQGLAAGESVDAAVVEGRLAVRRRAPQTFEWATPALFLRTLEIRPPRRRRRPLWLGLGVLLGVLLTLFIAWLLTGGPLSCARRQPMERGTEPAPTSTAPERGDGRAPAAPLPLLQRTNEPAPQPKEERPHQLKDLQTLQLAVLGSQLQAHFRHPARALDFSLISDVDPILTRTVTKEGTIRFATHVGAVKVEVLEIDWKKKEVTLRWRRE